MSLDFNAKNVMHDIIVRFAEASLPDARKKYRLKPVHQQELDIRGVASMAEMYNIHTRPEMIEEGFMAALNMMIYLAADGYKIKTPFFSLGTRIRGEYDGTESALSRDIYPEPRLLPSRELKNYFKTKVKLRFDGLIRDKNVIGKALDEATGLKNQVMTRGRLLTIKGYGLKIDADPENADRAGLYFRSVGGVSVKANVIAINTSRTLKAIVPAELEPGVAYTLVVQTMSCERGVGLLKRMRVIRSNFSLTV